MTVALVTGGTKGIGLAIVKALKAQGVKVAVVARSKDAPYCDFYIQADISKITDRHRIVRRVVDELGGIDILVNNAGSQISSAAIDYGFTDWKDQIELLLTAPFDLCQQAAKYMINKKYGRIINVSSVGGILGTRGVIGYSVAKAGLIEMTKCLSNEWLPHGITVNAIAPGFIETELQTLKDEHKTAMMGRIPAGRMGTCEEVATAVTWLASEGARYISGVCLPIDGGWLAR